MNKEIICCLCGKRIIGYGHNPEPLMDGSKRCCLECNEKKVIPTRENNWYKKEKKKTFIRVFFHKYLHKEK